MIEIGSVVLVIFSSIALCGLFRFKGIVFNMVSFFLMAFLQIVFLGYIASLFSRFGDLWFWFAVQSVVLIPVLVGAKKKGVYKLPSIPIRGLWKTFRSMGFYRQLLLSLPLLTCAVLGFLNGVVVLFCTPHQWDSLCYHIARVAYYLQNGSLSSYPANYWAQTMHPKISSVLQAWFFLVSDRNENWFQMLQFLSYWVAMLAIYGLCRRLFNRRLVSLFIALVFGLLVEVLLQATTPNNDLFLTALITCILLSLIEFRKRGEWQTLFPGAIAFGLAAGTKASFAMATPSIAVIAGWVFIPKLIGMRRGSFRQDPSLVTRHRFSYRAAQVAVLALVAGALVLPSGYLDNLKTYGHPLGSEKVREHHTFKGNSFRYVAGSASRNILRFGMDSLALEAPFPFPQVSQLHDALRRIPQAVITRFGIDLKQSHDSLWRFTYGKDCTAHEDISYWGVVGFALVFPLFASLFFRGRRGLLLLPFGVAAALFVFCQAWAGPYDPWRGRYFIQLAPFALPVLVFSWDARWRITKGYVTVILAFASFSSVCAVVLRPSRPLVSITCNGYKTEAVFTKTREEQMTASLGGLSNILRFEELVPASAVVGVRFPSNKNEYALFGKGLTRTIIPFPREFTGAHPFTGSLDYVVYCGSETGGSWLIQKVMPKETAKQAFVSIKVGISENGE